MRQATLDLIQEAKSILQEHNPMTLRQVYYQLVARHTIDNNRAEYQRLSNALVRARKEGRIPWEWLEDRTRVPREVAMWQDLPDFLNTVRRSYRKDIWITQPTYLEVWLEKEALAGIFQPILREYGVTLVVGRGYNSWSALKEAAERLPDSSVILYFGDFDPSGEDIVRAVKESLNSLSAYPEVVKVALTREDIETYHLPPDFTKKTDTRSKAFVKKHGDMAVELDALPLPVLQERITQAIAERLDKSEFEATRRQEREEQQRLIELLNLA